MKINMGVIKTIIAFAAVLNIIAMMVFDYDIIYSKMLSKKRQIKKQKLLRMHWQKAK